MEAAAKAAAEARESAKAGFVEVGGKAQSATAVSSCPPSIRGHGCSISVTMARQSQRERAYSSTSVMLPLAPVNGAEDAASGGGGGMASTSAAQLLLQHA